MTRKPWIKPEVRVEKLTDADVTRLRSSDNPMAELVAIKPGLVRGKGRDPTDPE